ncbi:MAG: hypothetical protein ABSA93_14360 [Streptosporangiaceae bacterium]|jgi:hypothetical protein
MNVPNPPGSGVAAPVNAPILRRQLRRATRQLWLFCGLIAFDALLVAALAAVGDPAGAVGFAAPGGVLAVAASFLVPYRRRLRQGIERAFETD